MKQKIYNAFMNNDIIMNILIIVVLAFMLSLLLSDDLVASYKDRIIELEQENEIIGQELATSLDIITGYKDEVRSLKLRPVILENEIKYWIDVQNKTGLDIDLLLHIQEKCIDYDVKLSIILGMIQAESNFDNTTINYNAWNNTYDRGLMQINSGYEEYYWNLSNINEKFDGKLVSNDYYNVELGISYLRYQLNNFDGYYVPALGAYNRGYEGYKKYVGVNNTEMTEYALRVFGFANNFIKE